MKASEASRNANLKLKPDILHFYNKCMAHISLHSNWGEKECLIVIPTKVVNEVCSLLIADEYHVNLESMPDTIVSLPGCEDESLVRVNWRGS